MIKDFKMGKDGAERVSGCVPFPPMTHQEDGLSCSRNIWVSIPAPQQACSPTALQPTPGRPASEQRVLLIRVPVSWGLAEGGVRRPSEQATFAGKASAGGLPRGRVCPGMACGKVPGQKGPFTTSRAGISNLF